MIPLEVIDVIVEDAIKSVIRGDMERAESPPTADVVLPTATPSSKPVTSSSEVTLSLPAIADRLMSSAIDSVMHVQHGPSAKKKIISKTDRGGGGKRGKKTDGKRGQKSKSHAQSGRFHKGHSFPSTDGGSIDLLDPSSLQPSLSRMSIAWSTTSTYDDSSIPPSPTELDNIVLRMVENVDDYSSLISDIAIHDALSSLREPDDLSTYLIPYKHHLYDPGQSKIDTFLHSLEEAGSQYSVDVDEERSMLPYSPRWYSIQKDTLRPVATGNWGCGAFKGDPQLKALLQWMAVSSNGRPELKYCTFKDARMEQVLYSYSTVTIVHYTNTV